MVQYSNAGIAVVGRVLEKVSEQPFAAVLKEKLLQPMGMAHSAFTPDASLILNMPEAHMWSYQGDRTIAPTFELGMSPAGSMYSSMNDLALFMGALINRGEASNGRLLKEKTLDQMWTPQSTIQSGRNRSFGIGFGLGELDGERSVQHGGAIYGFATQLKVLPDRKIGVAVATNLDMANGAINRIADHALRVLLAKQDNKAPPDYQISTSISAAKVREMTGLYR
jgi:CubicO group peptidase (beta-lactamase class C family)